MASEHHAPNHDYHLVDPSPWPALGALSGFVLAMGAVLYMHPDLIGIDIGVLKFVPGIILVLATMFYWWRDVVREASAGDHKPVVQLGLRYGMALFIASEVMFFAAFFWAYFDASLFPDAAEQMTRAEVTGGQWPPTGVETFDPFHLPFMNTLILLLSGCTVTWAHHALREGDRKGLIQGLWLTVLLGFTFTCLQAYEYSHATFGFTDGIYASTFFMATGFHGFHVIVGTIFLAVCLVRSYKGHFSPSQHFGFEAAAWYWHFVDVVWLFLFVAIYWWGA
ncbi:cytochrome c oxidase subunit 3 [Marivibrio halodurans]|uniref:Cytochrome c oxidase subunit 3 n=1 Tax=Marivibrio halodurans TaxID=2039722 RepID=A0A8J7S4Q1_9PROT|nr:cytochrome c oxidase subunit 3 [Marivibrio halodurans]MBP5858508.1 cytochrome c oxidase subunit 3 [Marivibrio halodurans]